jgi:DNA-binding XRE family transcriptional regulator
MMLPGLKKHRILAGYTQQELADKAGVQRITIDRIECLCQPSHPHTLQKLSRVLSVSTRELAEDPEDGCYRELTEVQPRR